MASNRLENVFHITFWKGRERGGRVVLERGKKGCVRMGGGGGNWYVGKGGGGEKECGGERWSG